MKALMAMLLCVSAFAQRPVSMVLDSVNIVKSDANYRMFNVCYHLTNQSGKPITFFLNTNLLVPVVSSSMSHSPHYKLYMNGKSVDVSGVFEAGEVIRRRFANDKEWEVYNDSLRKIGNDPAVWKTNMSRNIAKSKTTLNAG